MTASPAAFQLDTATSPEALLASLAALLPCRLVDSGERRSVVYDTCDGRLRRAGHLLWTESLAGHVQLHCRLAGSRADEQAELPAGEAPAFAWDLPAACRSRVSEVVGPRRLLPVLELERSERGLDVLDDEGKVVVRVRVPQGRARATGAETGEWDPVPPVLMVEAVRGYSDAHRDVLLIVATRPGLQPAQDEPASLERLCAGLARTLAPPPPALTGEMRADEGLYLMLQAQRAVLEANERGVREDIDIEFLHDFRVAVRRTRSLLRQFRRVLPADLVAHYRAEFAWLGRASNAVRDLDVFRLWVREQPDDPSLSSFVQTLDRRRREAYEHLVSELDSPRYRALAEGWRGVLGSPPAAQVPAGEEPPRRAGQPLAKVVARRIRRAYRRVLDAGRGLDADSPAPELHALRIRAKQLRYILDATAPIHDARLHERLVGSLKRLQAALGECNDANVQRATLEQIAGELGTDEARDAGAGSGTGTGSAAALLALGRLQARLEERERRARLELAGTFGRLDSERMRDSVRELTHPPADSAA